MTPHGGFEKWETGGSLASQHWWLLSAAAAAATPQKLDRKAFATKVCDAVDKAATANGIDRVFFARLLWKESLFDPNAVSPVGAEGIAQFMPDTAERRNLADPFDPVVAIGASAHFLSDLKKQFGNVGLAAGAYNAGERRIADGWRARAVCRMKPQTMWPSSPASRLRTGKMPRPTTPFPRSARARHSQRNAWHWLRAK